MPGAWYSRDSADWGSTVRYAWSPPVSSNTMSAPARERTVSSWSS